MIILIKLFFSVMLYVPVYSDHDLVYLLMSSISVYSDPDLAYVYPLIFSVLSCNDTANKDRYDRILRLVCPHEPCVYDVNMTCQSPSLAAQVQANTCLNIWWRILNFHLFWDIFCIIDEVCKLQRATPSDQSKLNPCV